MTSHLAVQEPEKFNMISRPSKCEAVKRPPAFGTILVWTGIGSNAPTLKQKCVFVPSWKSDASKFAVEKLPLPTGAYQ